MRTSASRTPGFDLRGACDEVVSVSDLSAFARCRSLASICDIKVGGSSGAVLAACADYLDRHPDARRAVCLCPDHGDNYNSTIWNDTWLKARDVVIGSTEEIGVFGPYDNTCDDARS